jgi:hypothetical protein
MRRAFAVTALIGALLAASAPAAVADPGGGGGGDGRNFNAYVRSLVRLGGTGYGGGKTSVPPDFKPPRCWYEPRFTYAEMVDWAARIRFVWHHQGPEDQRLANDWHREIRAEIGPHADESGKIFWFLTDDGTEEGRACYSRVSPFWRYVGPTAPAVADDLLIDPVDLARIARANLSLPDPVITLNPPGGRSFVGLETWVGLQPVGPRFVEAWVEGVPGLSARIDATPTRVEINVHGADATVQDGRRACPVYRKGAATSSGCWVRFNRASLGAPYRITVTHYWAVTTNVPGVSLPQGEVAASTTVRVDEIQANVTG